jgi:hypothetical protein
LERARSTPSILCWTSPATAIRRRYEPGGAPEILEEAVRAGSTASPDEQKAQSKADTNRETLKRYGYTDADIDKMDNAEKIRQCTAPSNPAPRTFCQRQAEIA